MKTYNTKSIISLAMLTALGLSACNINLTTDEQTRNTINKTSTGVIDALGQLSINGVTYDTSNASISTDGNEAKQSDLKLGMVVSVTGTENDDGTGNASQIYYEDITEGIVVSNNVAFDNTLNVMNQTVNIDDKTVFDSNNASITNPSEISAGNIVEVSGYTAGDGTILATRIEVKKLAFESTDEIEVKGKITNLTESTFNIGELKVSYTNSNLVNIADNTLDNTLGNTLNNSLDTNLKNNLYIEVSSKQGFNNLNELIADSINVKGDGSITVKHANNDQEVELKGLITDVVNDTTITVNGTTVYLSDNTIYRNGLINNLVTGSIIEIGGFVDADGNYQANRVKFENETENESNVESKSFENDNHNSNDSEKIESSSNDEKQYT